MVTKFRLMCAQRTLNTFLLDKKKSKSKSIYIIEYIMKA